MLLVDVVPKVGELSQAVGTLAGWGSAEDKTIKLGEIFHFTSWSTFYIYEMRYKLFIKILLDMYFVT